MYTYICIRIEQMYMENVKKNLHLFINNEWQKISLRCVVCPQKRYTHVKM